MENFIIKVEATVQQLFPQRGIFVQQFAGNNNKEEFE